MRTLNIKRRLNALEHTLRPAGDRGITLEALCRIIWRHDKKAFSELAKSSGQGFLIERFSREDAARRMQAHQRS
jgi:hypothetical protein